MNFRTAILALVFAASAVSPALAHPHIFARYNVTIAPSETGFINLHFVFTFQGVANPVITPGTVDTVQLGNDMLANIITHPFFIYLDMDGQSIGQQTVKPMITKDGGAYTFDLTLPDSTQTFGFALYDPSYFDSVWQADAKALTVKLDKFACTVQDEDIGKTVWGVLRAQYVQCASKTGPRPPPHSFKKLPMDQMPNRAPAGPSDITGRQFVP